MPDDTLCIQELAEALSPLSHSLAAGLLIRPVPMHFSEESENDGNQDSASDSLDILCHELDSMLKEAVPEIRSTLRDLGHSGEDELDELVDELASSALDLVDMARRIWSTPLSEEAEGMRPLLATLAEAPVAQLLAWILEVMHVAIDPWNAAEDPDTPTVPFTLSIPDAPVRKALGRWREKHPGILPDQLFH